MYLCNHNIMSNRSNFYVVRYSYYFSLDSHFFTFTHQTKVLHEFILETRCSIHFLICFKSLQGAERIDLSQPLSLVENGECT